MARRRMSTIFPIALAALALVTALTVAAQSSYAVDPAKGPRVVDRRAPQPQTSFNGVFVGTDDKVSCDGDAFNEQANGPGDCTFHPVFTAGDDNTGAEFDPQRVADELNDHPGWANGSQDIILQAGAPTITNLQGDPRATIDATGATKAKVTAAVNAHKAAKQPGQEFIFYVSAHGTNPANDPPWRLKLDGGDLTGAELVTLLTGFRTSVTVTVIIDACYSGNFIPLAPGIKDDQGQALDHDHLRVLTSANQRCPALGVKRNRGAGENPAVNGYWGALFAKHIEACLNPDNAPIADAAPYGNGDQIVTSDELFKCADARTRADPQYNGQDPQLYDPPGGKEVGGISLDPVAGGSSGSDAWLLEAIAGTAATAVVLGSAAWYMRKRRVQ